MREMKKRSDHAAHCYLSYGLIYEFANGEETVVEGSNLHVIGVANLKTGAEYRISEAGPFVSCTCDDLLRQKLNEALEVAQSPLRLACKHVTICAMLVQHFEKHGGGRWRDKGASVGSVAETEPVATATLPATPQLGVGELLTILLPSGRVVEAVVSGLTDRGGIELAKEGTAEWFPLSGLHFDGQVWQFAPTLLKSMTPRRSAFLNHLERKARREADVERRFEPSRTSVEGSVR